MANILTTVQLGQLLQKCDKLLINKYGIDLLNILKIDLGDAKTEQIMILLMQFDEIREIIIKYNLYEFIYNFIADYSNKKIFTLSTKDLIVTTKQPHQILNLNTLLTEKQLKIVFDSLENNLHLYDKLYRDKIFLIQSSIGRVEKIAISPTRLFHILGFDEKLISPKNQKGFAEFCQMFSIEDNIKSKLSDKKNLYEVIMAIIKREDDIISAVLEGKLNNTLNFPKIEMKNYSFERMGILEHSSGMIFYENPYTEKRHIKSDLFLLRDFIRNYKLEFIFEAYRPYKFEMTKSSISSSQFSNVKISDAESIFISQKGVNSPLINGQKTSISEKVGIYKPKDFEYTISQTDEQDGGEMPISDPIEVVEFTDEDKMKIIQSIIEGLPMLDNQHLKKLYDDLTYNLGGRTKFTR